MRMPSLREPATVSGRPRRGVLMGRLLLAALAGLAAALLVSCGGSNKALIPVAHAGPLLSDFEAVRNAAENADGNCSATEAALGKTEEDFGALPSTVDAGLRNNLHQGIVNLKVRAHELCEQPLAQGTGTTTTEKTTTKTETQPTTTTKTETQPTTSTTTPTVSTPTTTPSPGGGTPAPGVGETPTESENGGVGRNGGAGPEGVSPGAGVGVGPQEGGK
jgi:hypothetical protein